MSKYMYSQLDGLYGNMDGNPDNDMVFSNGSAGTQEQMSEQDVFEAVSTFWRVSERK